MRRRRRIAARADSRGTERCSRQRFRSSGSAGGTCRRGRSPDGARRSLGGRVCFIRPVGFRSRGGHRRRCRDGRGVARRVRAVGTTGCGSGRRLRPRGAAGTRCGTRPRARWDAGRESREHPRCLVHVAFRRGSHLLLLRRPGRRGPQVDRTGAGEPQGCPDRGLQADPGRAERAGQLRGHCPRLPLRAVQGGRRQPEGGRGRLWRSARRRLHGLPGQGGPRSAGELRLAGASGSRRRVRTLVGGRLVPNRCRQAWRTAPADARGGLDGSDQHDLYRPQPRGRGQPEPRDDRDRSGDERRLHGRREDRSRPHARSARDGRLAEPDAGAEDPLPLAGARHGNHGVRG